MGGVGRVPWCVVALGALCVSVLGDACTSSTGPGPGPLATAPAAVSPVVSESPRLSLGSGADENTARAAAANAAAAHLGVRVDDVTVVSVEPHDWNDAGLGCGETGQMYAQVVTPGYAVIVRAAGRELEFHTDSRGRAVLCADR